MRRSSKPERQFQLIWRALGGPVLIQEYPFFPGRRWRFDFFHPESGTAIEIEGGIWCGGRHTRGKGFENDCHKYNMATGMGYSVYRLTPSMINTPNLMHILKYIRQSDR